MGELAKIEFNEITESCKGKIPDTIEGTSKILNGLGGYLNTSEWYRAAVVSAWIIKGKPGPKIEQIDMSSSRQISITDFANLRIKGLSSRDSVMHYLAAWKSIGRARPKIGEEINLPDDPFPDWGTLIGLGGLKSSESVEWYTPLKYIKAAREVMGGIDLDPASSKMANEIVKASTYFTKDDDLDGLNQSWFGNVWLNPPYGKGSGLFTTKLIEEFKSKRVQSAILLLNAYGFDSDWFQPLWDYPICFTDHRIIFYSPQKKSGGPANANIFIYMGNDPEKFRDIFKEFGHIIKLWDD